MTYNVFGVTLNLAQLNSLDYVSTMTEMLFAV